MPVLKTIEATVRRYRMFAPGDRVVVGVSGGPDSVALVHALWRLRDRLRISLVIGHLNHQLRGSASYEDANFVRQLGEQLDLPVVVELNDVRSRARSYHLSLEAAAREARYRFFDYVAEKRSAQKIATGHTANDQAETILMRLFRGSGTSGASGIRPVLDGRIVRPLLRVTRREVDAYLAAHHLTARMDVSNTDLSYLRNRIRHTVLPRLEEEYNPEIVAAFGRFGEVLRAEEEFLEHEADQVFQQSLIEQQADRVLVAAPPLQASALALQRRVIRRAVAAIGGRPDVLTFDHVERTLTLIEHDQPGRILALPGGLRVERRREAVLFRKGAARPFEVTLDIPGTTELPESAGRIQTRILDLGDVPPPQDRTCAVFDAEAIQEPVIVRTRRPGDRLDPIGMAGTKPLKALLNEWAIPRLERDSIPLLVSRDRILWVIGRRVSRWAAVSPQTKQVLVVEWEGTT